MNKEDFDIINEYKTLIEMIKCQREEIKRERDLLQLKIDKAISYINSHKETKKHYEPYGTPMGNPNYTTTHVYGYYELLEILKG